jgi:hypothetical protein
VGHAPEQERVDLGNRPSTRSFTDSRSRHAERRCPAVRQVGKASLLPAIALAALSTAVLETAGRVFTHAQLARSTPDFVIRLTIATATGAVALAARAEELPRLPVSRVRRPCSQPVADAPRWRRAVTSVDARRGDNTGRTKVGR